MYKNTFLISCVLILLSSCKKDEEIFVDPPVPEPVPCENFVPVVMVHGFLGSGDTYTNQLLRFASNGCDETRIYAFDWNSLGEDDNVALLDAFIDKVLSAHAVEQVDLVGHSAGGGLSWDYISDSVRVLKIAHYVHLGSGATEPVPGAAASLPILNIYSVDDTVVEGGDIDGAENVKQTNVDHYQVATNAETFDAMYSFLRDGEKAETDEIEPEDRIFVSGKALTFGENQPETAATIAVYELESATGKRISEIPDHSFTAGDEGAWGPFEAKAGTHYEFYIAPADPHARTIHYYREPFIRSNPLVYLRTFPPPGGLAGLLTAILPSDDEQGVMAAFISSQAVISGRDFLQVDDFELSSEALASADQTTIAFFLFDNGDSNTSGDANALLSTFPFLNGADVFFPVDDQPSSRFEFNGRVMNVPAWRSETEGVNVIVFD